MKAFVGIDLGTTNSAISSYDGDETRVWKSPEQNDVTPSALLFDRRGNKYVGRKAYDSAQQNPGNSATLFKRYMGTSSRIPIDCLDRELTPEECSAEILRTLFGYLPEEVRTTEGLGTVITVPAAFNQMQKNATLQAAEQAGIGAVALMQEPVAAVMSVVRARDADGTFMVYDLGGGTLDIALAESIGGRVNLLSHDGIAQCGGRDFDRDIVDGVIKRWLFEQFDLPDDFSANKDFEGLRRMLAWAAERAKIELSAREDVSITLSEIESRTRDLKGEEIYLDVPLARAEFDKLIRRRLDESIEAARGGLQSAGMRAEDIDRVVFVGGPTHYKPLRDVICAELGLPASTEVNPMTAVAEGAAIFAESLDWSEAKRGRKSSRGRLAGAENLAVTFNFIARTPAATARLVLQLEEGAESGSEFQVDSLDTGWSSGRVALKDGAGLDLPLGQRGENTFQVFVFGAGGASVKLPEDRIVVARTAATIDAIPASHAIGIESAERSGGRKTVGWIINVGDPLPKQVREVFKAEHALKAGGSESLNFRLYEGTGRSDDPADNRFIGQMKIQGQDFDSGVISAGADLICDVTMQDSGAIVVEIEVPDVGGAFRSDRNFYSWQGEGADFTTREGRSRVADEGRETLERTDALSEEVDDPRIEEARARLQTAADLDPDDPDAEAAQEAMESVVRARATLAEVRMNHLPKIRRAELARLTAFFDDHIREHARPSEATSFDNLRRTAERAIDTNSSEFEDLVDQLRQRNFEILWRLDWFVVDMFKRLAGTPHRFSDRERFESLCAAGVSAVQKDDIDELRGVIAQLWQIEIAGSPGMDASLFDGANIVRSR